MSKKNSSLTSLESDGNTSFLRAARAGHLDKVLEHLKSNIDINTSNANGLNALHLASKDGHVDVVEELLKRGATVDAATKKGNTALHIASLAGQEDVVKLLVNHGASVNVKSQNGFTPLYMAAQENHDNVVKYLLSNGANQSLATEDGFTPLAVAMQQGHDKVVTVLLENDTRGKVRLPALHIAAKKDDVKAAKLLLENDHNPDVTSKSGFTPLHIASHYGNESIANLLIQKKADVNYSAKHNITPLHVAAKWGKTNMVSLLLEKGANIESKTRDGLTPLHCAARSGHEQVVDMLLEREAPISCKTKNGLAPLHMAAQGDHVDAARILLYHRAPVDEVTVDYLTALHVAAHCGHVRVAKLLLDRQADPNARALNGFTPLHIACKKNRIKVVELLLKHGASISATTESGLTPLHVASFMGCMNIVIYLLQHDANPDVPTVRGETPLHLAARANQTDIIRILLRNGAQVDARAREQQTPLHIASRLGNVDIVMLLLQHGAKVDTTTKDMYTALHIASKEGHDEVAGVLIENGASLNATTKKGFTPLHLAAKYGNIKVAKLLLQKEAPVDAQGKNGVTPLHVASHYDHQNVALLLLDKGASPHATAKNGHTPLHIAAKKNQMDIANTLLEYGAKPNAESKAGFTPLHLSAQEGHAEMSSLLIEHEADTNQQAKNGLTPLHLCAQEDRVPVAEILVKNNAVVDKTTKAGYTPLHVASHYGQPNMVKFLLSQDADVKATTSIGYTPLHQAAQQGHTNVVNILLEKSADPNAITHNGQTPLNIAQKLGYITVIETLKTVTEPTSATGTEEKYKVVAPEAMHETFMSDSEEEGGEDTMLGDNVYRYLTADEMKSLGDDSLPIDVTRDERIDSNKMVTSADSTILPPQAIEDTISPQHYQNNYAEFIKKYTPDNVDIARHPINIGFLVSFLVDARGGAMRGCRHSGVRVIVPPRSAGSPTRITCRYVRPQRTPHPPPLMEGEALASRVLELGPVGAKFLGPVIIEVPHFAALRGKEREIVILRSDNGETWREHTVESSEDILNEVLTESFEAEDISQLEDTASGRITRILTSDFPQYFAVVSRIRQEVHAIGPEGGMVSSTVVPQVQAVFPQGALTKKIKVGLQAQPIDPELTAKLLGHGVAVSPVVTVEPRRRKFHKAITLSMPAPRAHSQGMINQYSGSTPTLRLLCSITGGTTRAQWEDVTGSTPLTFVNDCVSFTTTVSARFWLMDCRNISDATKMATELYREAIHVPFMAKFVVFAKRVDPLEARLRVFCMTDDKEDKTLEHQEHFTEVAKSRDVEVLEGKPQYIEFAGNLVPITKSGEQLQFAFRAFRENRLPFSVKVKDQHAEAIGRSLFMREPKVAKGEPPQQPICILNIVLPDDIVADTISLSDSEHIKRHEFLKENYEYYRPDPRLADMSNLLGEDWVPLATQLGLTSSEINVIKSEYPDSVAKQAQSMLRMWISQSSNRSQGNVLENALKRIGREDIIPQCLNEEHEIIKKEETVKYRIKKDISLEDRDIMKDSESIESLVHIDRKEDKSKKRGSYDKYSAEEKVVEEPSDEEDFNKTVAEKRVMIEKRLSVERTIPASQQRTEIVQEITSIKRQSIVEDKIAEVEQKRSSPSETKPIAEEAKTTISPIDEIGSTTVKTVTTESKPEMKTVTTDTKIEIKTIDIQPEVVSKTATIESKPDVKTSVKTIVSETRTTQEITTDITHKPETELLEGVTQRLETKRIIPKISADEDPKSPKLSKTPPPSPADFILREQAAAVQDWEASGKELQDESALQAQPVDAAKEEISNVPLTHTSAEITALPQPKPRSTKTSESQLELTSPLEQFTVDDTQISPVRDDAIDIENVKVGISPSESIIESYSERKKFWENVSSQSQDIPIKKRMSLQEESAKQIIPMKRTSIHEVPTQPPIPKPRTIQTAQSFSESIKEEAPFVPVTEYQSSFKDPSKISPKIDEVKHTLESADSIDSDNENSCQFNTSSGYENTGYISDSGDVEHYISDSEIEDRVPQIRERQMSVFQPPSSTRKSIYERSCSLPTEDLYEVSAQSILLRKQYFEEQIKKDMVEDELMTEIEEEPSPEHKTLGLPIEEEDEEPSGVKSVPDDISYEKTDIPQTIETIAAHDEKAEALILEPEYDMKTVSDLKKVFETEQLIKEKKGIVKDIVNFEEIVSEENTHIYKTHKTQEIQQSSTESDSILDRDSVFDDLVSQDETVAKPSDSIEVHVDKSEIEDSEKMTDLDATDVETKSTDSLNAPELSPKTLYNQEDIPEITISLSEKQRRISEDSEDSVEKPVEIKSPIPEATSPIYQPEEHIQDTIWEVSVESHPQTFEERVTDIQVEKQVCLDKDDDLSSSVRDESDLGSEIHQDHSESGGSDRRSESQADIEKLILESLHHQKISPEEARIIASELIADIEAEIHRRNSSDYEEPPAPEYAKNQVSDYLKQLAESKGLDSREVELVQSVLARKQRELSKLSRGDTQASSMEITDEDLRYSGADFSPTGSRANILEEQIDQLEAEKIHDEELGEEFARDIINEVRFKESSILKDYEVVDEDKTVHVKSELDSTTTENIKGEKTSKERKDVIMEEDETILDSVSEEAENIITKIDTTCKQKEVIETDEFKSSSISSAEVSDDIMHIAKVSSKLVSTITDDKVKEESTVERTEKDQEIIKGTYSSEEISRTILDDENIEKTISETRTITGTIDKDFEQKDEHVEETDISGDVETTITKQHTHTKESSSSTIVNVSHQETVTTSNKFFEDIDQADIADLIASGQLSLTSEMTQPEMSKIGEMSRTLSSESKSSLDGKSHDDVFSTCSSGRKEEKVEVILRKHRNLDDTSSSSSNLKPDRKSGLEFEAYSSSGESHYQSFEIDSTKSRPCSSDVEGLIAAGSSEYESALTSQDISAPSNNLTSTEYHTAVSSLSSKESMKSLDSESSGHLASFEVSEASETLVPSEFELGGEERNLDDDLSCDQPLLPTRQSTECSESEFIPEDLQQSIDISEEDFVNDVNEILEPSTKMKRSQEMTFQPEPKSLVPDSPLLDGGQEVEEKLGTSLDDGSVLSMSLSSTSSAAAQRTVIELSHAESERLEGVTPDQLSIDDPENIGSRESLFQTPIPLTSEIATSTHQFMQEVQIDNVTLTTSVVDENGIQSVCTQVISQTHTPEMEKTLVDEFTSKAVDIPESKKRGHRRSESTSFIPVVISQTTSSQVEMERKLHSDLAESDKYTHELSYKEVESDEKKDVDEKEESYETEADQALEQYISDEVYAGEECSESIEGGKVVDDIILTATPKEYSPISESVRNTEIAEQCSEAQEDAATEAIEYSESITKQVAVDRITHKETIDKRDSHGKSSTTSSEKSSFEEAEAEAAFSMVPHVSPAHKAKQICPILEDEDAEKHELETRERVQKEFEERRQQIMKDQSPSAIPDIKVTQHMTPMDRKGFHYPDLELEEKEDEAQLSTPQTPASNSSRSSESTDQGGEYILDHQSDISIPEESDSQLLDEKTMESRSEGSSVVERTATSDKSVNYEVDKEMPSPTESPNSDSFEMLEKPDLIDEFVVIEEVAKEAHEADLEGKSVRISKGKLVKKHDTEVEELLVKSAPSPSTKMTDIKYYPEGSSSDELGFEFEDSPPNANQKNAGVSTKSPRDYVYEYDRELEANKKWIEQQFQGDQAAMIAAGYGYEMEFERCPLEDIKEEDDFDSRMGSLNSQKESGGSLGSVKDSYSSTPEYDVLAGRKYFTKSGEHDDISMNSLQEFENLERAMSLENRRFHQGSQDSITNGSFKTRYFGRSGQGDDVSVSSLKEFEGLEMACIAAHKVEVKVKEEEMLLAQIDEGPESLASETESCETVSGSEKKQVADSDEEDYEKRMFEIDEIIRQAQTNVERFIDLKEGDKTESIGRGDSIEEVSKVPDLDLDAPLQRTCRVQWGDDDVMQASTDSLDNKEKPSLHGSTDSLDQRTAMDIMTASTDSIEFQGHRSRGAIMTDSIEIKESHGMTSSDSLELATGNNLANFSDSIDEDGSRIGGHDQSSSSTGKDVSLNKEDDTIDNKVTDFMLESTDSIASTSTATHATYQYETDSVFSGSFTSGGSNTMVSSTDNIDPVTKESVDLAEAVRKVWFGDEYDDDESKPYVTEVIEPGETEVKRYTFKGPDAEQHLKQFIENFNEGEEVHEEQTVDEDGNVRIKRTIQKRIVIRDDGSSEDFREGIMKRTYIDEKGTKTIYTQQFEHSDDPNFDARSLLTSIAGDSAGEASVSWEQVSSETAKSTKAEKDEASARTPEHSTHVFDQQQLSEETKELLKDMEKDKESKK